MSVQHQGVGVEGRCAPSSMECEAERNSSVKHEQNTRVMVHSVTSFIAGHFIAVATYIEPPSVAHNHCHMPCHNLRLDDSAVAHSFQEV